MTPDSPRRFAAFISYSHADRRTARWLHRAIESYRPPRGVSAEPLTPVFLDREELASSNDLAESVRSALQQSAALIVVCSPAAVRSRWVNEEIRFFKTQRPGAPILTLIAQGGSAADSFPPALRFEVESGLITDHPAPEPLAADLRRGADGRRDALLKIVAALLGVGLDGLRRREQRRRIRRLAVVSGCALAGCLVLAALAVTALIARNEAERQRQLAERKSLTAQRTADFMISLFKVSDPDEARGNSITAREILDRGAQQIDHSLRDEPQVRADLSTTLGEVYTGLGLYDPAQALLIKAAAAPGQDAAGRLRAALADVDLQYQRGDDDAADAAIAKAAAIGATSPGLDPLLQAQLLVARGEVAAIRDRNDESRRDFQAALALGRRIDLGELRPRALEGMALNEYYANDLPAAARAFEVALRARTDYSGDSHPKISDSLTNLGSIAYRQGDSARAEQYWLRSLALDQRMLGADHPKLTATMNNIGRVRLEARRFAAAVSMLGQARAIQLRNKVNRDDGMIFTASSLGLAYLGEGNYRAAEPLLQEALAAAVANDHRLHGPVLTDLADLECRTGRARQGYARLAAARAITANRYPDEPWRVALVDNVAAGCLAALGRMPEARALAGRSTPQVLAHWKPATLYGHDALEREQRLEAQPPGS